MHSVFLFSAGLPGTCPPGRFLGALMARPRGVAEFTKTVAEFTKSSLAGQKSLQVSKILLIFVARLLHTNDINTI
jgi:hypothetical protein